MLYNDERPLIFDSVVGQEHIVDSIRNQSLENKWFSVYILAGQYGGGKTTLGRIISKAANCQDKDERGNPCLKCESCQSIHDETTTDIIEIDAASNTGVESIRSLKDGVDYMPVNLKTKVYIIDEVHMLSKQAFNALLKVLEEPPKNVIFILCTTELNAIPITIRSRAATYIFEQIPYEKINHKLYDVAVKRELAISDDALTLIAKNAKGSMRDAYSLLEQVTSSRKERIESDDVRRILGISDPSYLFQLLGYIVRTDIAACIQSVEKAVSKGKNLDLMIDDLLEIVTDAVVAKSTSIETIHETEIYKEGLKDIIDVATVEQLCQIADGLMEIRVENRKCPSKTTVIVGIIRITKTAVTKSFISRLEALEQGIVVSPGTYHRPEHSISESGNSNDVTMKVKDEVINCDRQQEQMPSGFEHLSECESSPFEPATDIIALAAEERIAEKQGEPVSENTSCEGEVEEQKEAVSQTEQHECSISHDELNSGNDEKILVEDSQQLFTPDNGDNQEEDDDSIFSILEDFSIVTIGNTCTTEKKSASGNGEATRQRQLEERLSIIVGDDKVFTTALQGCIKTMKNGKMILRTPLKPIFDIINTFLMVTQVSDITVEYDPLIVLV